MISDLVLLVAGSQAAEHVGDGRSPITSHVLDIARGCPAQGVQILLELEAAGSQGCAWSQLGCGFTNQDGRVPDLLPASHRLQPGCYRCCHKDYWCLFSPDMDFGHTKNRCLHHFWAGC